MNGELDEKRIARQHGVDNIEEMKLLTAIAIEASRIIEGMLHNKLNEDKS